MKRPAYTAISIVAIASYCATFLFFAVIHGHVLPPGTTLQIQAPVGVQNGIIHDSTCPICFRINSSHGYTPAIITYTPSITSISYAVIQQPDNFIRQMRLTSRGRAPPTAHQYRFLS